MIIEDLKYSNYLVCVKTHICDTVVKGKVEYLQGVKYKCRFEKRLNYNCIYIEYPDRSEFRKMLFSDNSFVIEYLTNYFMTQSEYRKLIVSEFI